jgi:glycosyltransferase involved in cell wall biosynthesis
MSVPAAVELSLVMPCYNEAACLAATAGRLVDAFEREGVPIELVLVDNGSRDETGRVIDELIAQGLPVVKGVVERNEGQGLGILTGLTLARGRHVGYIGADGQVAADDVVRLFRSLRESRVPALVKARRRNRQDGFTRRAVSAVYNLVMQAMFFGVPAQDINCNPKLMPVEVFRLLDLRSRDWFLEAEVMLKIRHLRVAVVEMDVADRPRAGGRSHVKLATVLEFLRNIATYRFTPEWRAWQRTVAARALDPGVQSLRPKA